MTRHPYPLRRSALFIGWVLAVAPAVGQAQTQIQTQKASPLASADYRSQVADINGDGHPDLLLRPRPSAWLTATDDHSVPVPLAASLPTLLFRSTASGDYVLDPQAPRSELNHSAWSDPAQPSHELHFSDALVKSSQKPGSVLLIRGRQAGGPHFLIAIADPAAPHLLQRLSSADLGVELGGEGTTVDLKDRNDDGRADLLVRTAAPPLSPPRVFIARSNGTFGPDVQGDLYSVWQGLLDALAVPDVEAALVYVDDNMDESYRREFRQVGDEIKKFPQHIGNPRAVEIQPQYAEFVITQSFEGETAMHFITFVRQNNAWVLSAF